MKTGILAILIMLAGNAFCQDRPELKNDTLYYQGTKFYVGQKIRLGYGSGTNKAFAFVWTGTGITGYQTMTASYSKESGVVEKIYIQRKKYYLRAKPDSQILANKFFMDVEGAIDNKELLIN